MYVWGPKRKYLQFSTASVNWRWWKVFAKITCLNQKWIETPYCGEPMFFAYSYILWRPWCFKVSPRGPQMTFCRKNYFLKTNCYDWSHFTVEEISWMKSVSNNRTVSISKFIYPYLFIHSHLIWEIWLACACDGLFACRILQQLRVHFFARQLYVSHYGAADKAIFHRPKMKQCDCE